MLGRLRPEHAVPALVALAIAVAAVQDGGYQTEFVAGASVLAWWVLALGVALGVLPRSPLPGAGLLAGALMVAAAGFTALSIDWALDDGQAFDESIRMTAATGVFALALACSRRGDARLWIGGLALGLGAVALIALGSRFEPALSNEDAINRAVGSTSGRLAYPLGYWNAVGACMAMLVVLLAWFGSEGRALATRVAATAAVPLPALAIYLAASRGSILAGTAGLAVLVAAHPRRSAIMANLGLTVPAAALLLAVTSRMNGVVQQEPLIEASGQGTLLFFLVLAVVGVLAAIRRRIDDRIASARIRVPSRRVLVPARPRVPGAGVVAIDPAQRLDDFKAPPASPAAQEDIDQLVEARALISDSSSGRYQIWGTALDAFEEDPLRGIGAGGFRTWFDRHGTLYYPIRSAHSQPLELMAELGIIGLGLFVALIAVGVVAGVRRLAGGMRSEVAALLAVVGSGLVSVSVDWSWEFLLVSSCLLVAIALLCGPATLEGVPGGMGGRRRGGPLAMAAGAAAILLSGFAIWASGTAFLAERDLAESRAAVARNDLRAAEQAALDAVDREPWSAKMRAQLALVAERRLDFETALAAARAANARAPEDGSLWFLRARIELRASNVDAAQEAFDRARRLQSQVPGFRDRGLSDLPDRLHPQPERLGAAGECPREPGAPDTAL